MIRNIICSDRLGEQYTEINHPSGLKMLLYPMKGYGSAYACFATKYGSIDNCFKTQNDTDFAKVPEGIAHFLEHKMFENEDGIDTFARYAETGASPNAYTTFDHTAYYFSCTEKFEENLEILLDFVSKPYFTEQTVQKEQGIIGQEIQMYMDRPDWRVVLNLLIAVYHNNPVRVDTVGTIESISRINEDILYRCYNTFYNLHNMVLVVSGNFEIDAVLRVADRLLKTAPEMLIDRFIHEEPDSVNQAYIQQRLTVAQPLFQLGFKVLPASTEKESLLNQIQDEVLLDVIAGESTSLYRRMYDTGLVNAEFGTETMAGRGYCVNIFAGESREPKKVQEEIIREIEQIKRTGIDPVVFSRAKKAAYGRYVGMLDKVSTVSDLMLLTQFSGAKAFDLLEMSAGLTLEELQQRLKLLDFDRCALSVVCS